MRTLVRQVALLAMVSVAVFLLMKASPLDPVDAYLGPAMAHVGPDQRAQIAASWGLDRPVHEQFLAWAGHVLRGDLGFSTTYNAPVAQVMGDRIGASLALTGLAWQLSGAFGFALGLVAAAWAGGALDRTIRVYCYVLAATPTFAVMAVLAALGKGPVEGMCLPGRGGALSGMAFMYTIMSAFHSPPWLRRARALPIWAARPLSFGMVPIAGACTYGTASGSRASSDRSE